MDFFKKVMLSLRQVPLLVEARFDKYFIQKNIPTPTLVPHSKWRDYIFEMGNKPGLRILELGSREVTGESDARERLSKATYVGFDIYPGRNVDVVGDAHKLSNYFKEEEKFDIIFSSACFEHFAMPWTVATEIAKMLKVGGIIFVETHFSHVTHERPWNFFQYSDMGLKTLFSPALGFKCLDVGFSNPIVGRFSSLADKYLRNKPLVGLYCHVEFLGKKIRDVKDFDWTKVNLDEVVGNTKYPEPKTEEIAKLV